jgi:hypothetical protein
MICYERHVEVIIERDALEIRPNAIRINLYFRLLLDFVFCEGFSGTKFELWDSSKSSFSIR